MANDKCQICGNKFSFFGTGHYKCKICRRTFCGRCGKDDICNICREKMK